MGMGSKEKGEKYYPSEENLGKSCMFWKLGGNFRGCNYPKVGLEGRMSCEGVIDDVCLFKIRGRIPRGLSLEQIEQIKTQIPGIGQALDLPPGEIEK